MDKNIEVDFTEFMNSLDAIGRQFIISQNIQPEKLEETCCDCGKKFYTYIIGDGQYQWWIFPFQLCSVPMYLCLIIPFIKEGKIKKSFYLFLSTYNLLGGFVAMFEPSGLSHSYWTLTLHAYIWHLLLVFIGFLIIFNKKGLT